jgi:predicted phage tail component-like protein
MANNYDFLRTFTFDGKETNHLFQIAKVTIPFLSKDNEFYTVGNTDGKKFSGTRLGEHSIQIDGFVIKDNTGKSVSDSMDELKLIINSDEPKQLIFDIFPDRYFNAIFSGVQEYDATNLEYTPLSLVFDVPDGLAHSIHSKVDSNVYTIGTNLVLDSEYTNPKKYMAQWARVEVDKHDGSTVINGNLSSGLPVGYKPKDQYYWVNNTEYTRRNIQTLSKGNTISFSIEAKVTSADSDPNITKAGMLRAEMWQSNPLKLIKYVDINIPKNATSWQKYGVTLSAPTDTVDMINLAYCLNGKANVSFSKPMMSLLPPLVSTVKEPIAGATLYSNSLDWGDYDYSGNPNLLPKINKSAFTLGTGGTVTDGDDNEVVFTLDGSGQLLKYDTTFKLPPLLNGETYTISCEIKFHSDVVGDLKNIRLAYNYLPGGVTMVETDRPLTDTTLNKWIKLKGTRQVQYTANAPQQWYIVLQDAITANRITGTISLRNIKVEKGSTATPYQPNLKLAPYYVSHNYDDSPLGYYKYRGLGTFPSNNPHDYSWSYDPSYYKAVTYVPSEEGIADVVEVNNNGTYNVAPKFSFTMNGENGLVGLINENGGLLQFGNPQDVDGTTPTRQEWGLNEGFYGNTLNPNIKVNTGFKSVYPNMNSNPTTPNLFQGSWNMTTDIDTATPQFATAPSQAVWHGPSMVLAVQAPSDNDRSGNFRARVRFNFDNRSKRARGRTEVSVIDTSGNYVMGAVIRDSDTTSDNFVFESWYKDKMIKSQTITKNIFNKSFFELALYRTGKEILWKFTQIKSLNANSTVNDDKVIWVSWNLDADDTSEINEVGIWQMRYQGYEHVLMSVTDVQGIWSHTKYWQDIENTFQDGDIVEIDVNSRSLYINGTVNNTLNVVGNEWEKFYIDPGKTIIQPVVSTWANKAVVTAEFSESFL